MPLSDKERAVWTQSAVAVSWVSIAVTLVTGLVGLICAAMYGSMAMLGYGLESFVDVFSSVMVVWRFSRELDPSMSEEETEHAIYSLEKRSGVGISITFVLIALVVGIQALFHLAHSNKPSESPIMIVLASLSVVVFVVLGTVKWHISDKLESTTLRKDAICSLAVAVISLAVTLSASAYASTDELWWFDAVVAILVAGFLLVYGARTLCCHGHAWWTSEFWGGEASELEVASDLQPTAVESRV